MYHITSNERALLINEAEDIFNGKYEKILLYTIIGAFQEIQKSGILIEADEQGHISKSTCTKVMKYILNERKC